jgi:hypothetical protein
MSERVALRPIALPIEHGGWGFLAEPVLLGMLVAPSWAGLALGLAALGAFLARHPLKLALADRRKAVRYPRTAWAERFACLYAGLALLALVAAFATAHAGFWLPLALAAPLGLIQLRLDLDSRGREMMPELLGAVALTSLAASMLLAGGFSTLAALVAWLILAVRGTVSVLYVRARFRLDRGLDPRLGLAWASHISGLLLLAALASLGLAPRLAAFAFAMLLARALVGLSRFRRPVRPQTIGLQELALGLATVVLLAFGYNLGL